MEPAGTNGRETEIEKEEEGLTLEKAREILADTQMSDEELSKVIHKIKIFCKVAYELYAAGHGNKHTDGV